MSDADAEVYVELETARILAEIAAADLPDRSDLPVDEARQQMEAGNAQWNADLPAMAEARDLAIEGPMGSIAIRLLRPEAIKSEGAIVFFHGGGFVLGSLESHHRLMRLLSIETGAALIGVDYCLAPENPFPAPLDDCAAVVRWLQAQAGTLNIDPTRIVLAGDSAGANLALACLLKLRDAGDPLPAGAALFYGCYWARLGTESHRKYGGGAYHLSSKEMAWFWNHYLGVRGKGDPLAEPMDAELAGLPPLFLNYGEVDPLADDTRELMTRLDRAGVVHDCISYPGLVHGFLQWTSRVELAAQAVADAGQAIRDMLH